MVLGLGEVGVSDVLTSESPSSHARFVFRDVGIPCSTLNEGRVESRELRL